VRDQLLSAAVSHYEVLHDELDQTFGMRITLVLEIKPVWSLNNTNCFLMGVVLQNQLLQKQKCTLVSNSLPHLNLASPGVRCPCLLTIFALLVLNHEFYLESLLKQRATLYFLLNSQFYFYSTTVRLCPNKFSVDKFNFLETFHLLKA